MFDLGFIIVQTINFVLIRFALRLKFEHLFRCFSQQLPLGGKTCLSRN